MPHHKIGSFLHMQETKAQVSFVSVQADQRLCFSGSSLDSRISLFSLSTISSLLLVTVTIKDSLHSYVQPVAEEIRCIFDDNSKIIFVKSS